MKEPFFLISRTTAVRILTVIISILLYPFMCMAQESNVSGNGEETLLSYAFVSPLDSRLASSNTGVTSAKGLATGTDTYNSEGDQATAISGPGFSQMLHYTDGPGKALYNGSVSSMTWTMGSDGTQRGYRYTYNGYGWLTLAEYAEGSSLSSNKDRYTERFLNFMPNGGIRRLQRHGLKADGNYGQPFKFGGKDLISSNRLNEHDFETHPTDVCGMMASLINKLYN